MNALRRRTILRVILLSLAIYVLAYGPVRGFYLAHGLIPPPAILSFVYFPLDYLSSFGGIYNPLLFYAMSCELILGGH